MFPRLSTVFRYGALLVLVLISCVMIFQLGADSGVISDDIVVPSYDDISVHRDPPLSKPYVTTGLLSRGFKDSVETQVIKINPHTFRYLINSPTFCKGRHIFLITYVHTAPANFKKRMMIRETWGHQSFLRRHNMTVVYITGTVADITVMNKIKMEASRYGDIIQEDFTDSYRNLTHKAIAGIKFVSTFCPNAKYVLKTDDDILVNFHYLLDYIINTVENSFGSRDLILCNQWIRMKVMRDKRSKWYIPKEDFQDEYFPPYCSGSAYLMSSDVVNRMYKASMTTPFFWVDDYYITGMLIQKLNITHKRFNQAYVLHPGIVEEKYNNDQNNNLMFFHVHKLRLMYNLWKNMTMNQMSRAKISQTHLSKSTSRSV